MKGKGKWLEEDIARIAAEYRRKGLLHLEKVDPPLKVTRGRVIFLENPFLDFVGTWTERGGRSVQLEAKSTDDPTLPLDAKGLTPAQQASLARWRDAGAAVGILWGMTGTSEIRYVPLELVEAQLRGGIKHVKWPTATPIPRGLGWVTWDFLEILRLYHPY